MTESPPAKGTELLDFHEISTTPSFPSKNYAYGSISPSRNSCNGRAVAQAVDRYQQRTQFQPPQERTSGNDDGTPSSFQCMKASDIKTSTSSVLDVESAIDRIGMGRFQFYLLVAAGLCFASDAMEVLLLSFLAVVLQLEWDLSERQTDTIVSVVFAGAMIGTLVLGPLGDVVGRQPLFRITAALIAMFGIWTAFVTSYEQFLIVRFLVGFGVGGLTVPFDTLAEFLPSSLRGRQLLAIEFFWTAGTLMVPLCAWLTLSSPSSSSSSNANIDNNDSNWPIFVLVCSIPCVFSTLLALVVVPESPRWLVTQGRSDEALHILRKAAQLNGKQDLQDLFPSNLVLVDDLDNTSEHFSANRETVWDLFSPKWLRITLSLWGAWFGFSFLYYGVILQVSLVFSSSRTMEDDSTTGYDFDYAAILISGSSELVGLLIVLATIDRWGRVATQATTYILGGVCAMALGVLASMWSTASATTTTTAMDNAHHRIILIALAFGARMMMMGASCTTWVSTSEILSTDVRTTGHSAANAVARLSGFLTPYVINNGTSLHTIGWILGLVGCFTSYIAWHLPETKGRAMGHATSPTIPTKSKITATAGLICTSKCTPLETPYPVPLPTNRDYNESSMSYRQII